jgi:hypothetical protein
MFRPSRVIRWPFRVLARLSPAARHEYIHDVHRAITSEHALPPELLRESEAALDETIAGLKQDIENPS